MRQQSPYEIRARVLGDGHVDRITGPRCMIQPSEGPHYGLYLIAHTAEVLQEGTPVFFDTIMRRARPSTGGDNA